MKILDRYLLRELLAPFALGLFVFTFVVLTNALTRMLDLLLSKGVGFLLVAKLLALSMPHLLVLTIPMSVLLATLLAFGRLSADSEITALKASGIPLRRLMLPAMGFALAAYLATQALYLVALPSSNTALQSLRFDLLNTRANVGIKPRVFSSDFSDLVLYVEDMDPDSLEMRGIFLTPQKSGGDSRVIVARRGRKILEPEKEQIILRLEDAAIHEIPENRTDRYSVTPGIKEYDMRLDIAYLKRNQVVKSDRSMTVRELRQKVRQRIENGHSPNPHLVEIHKKFSIPFACLVFGLIGVPLGISARRSGKSSGFAVSIGIFLLYYMFLAAGEGLGDEGALPPWLAMWLPNMVLGGLGVFMVHRASRERPFAIISWGVDTLLDLVRRAGVGRSVRFQAWWEKRSSRREGRIHRRSQLRILDRYVGSSFLRMFLYIFSALVIVSVLVHTFEKVDDFTRHEAGIGQAIFTLACRAPFFAFLSVHFAVLVATILTISLLSRSSELVAMFASGISFPRLVLPILILSLGISVGSFLLDEVVVPVTNRQAEESWDRIKDRGRSPFVYNRRWYRGQDDSIFYYQSFDSRREAVVGFSLFRRDDQGNIVQRIEAPEMVWNSEEERWIYHDAREIALTPEGRILYDRTVPTLRAELLESPADFAKEIKDADEMNRRELREYIATLERSGFDADAYWVDYHSKLSLPFISILMVLLGAPLALQSGRSSGMVGVATALLIGFAYFLIFKVFQEYGHAGRLPPLAAAWVANLLCLGAGLTLLRRART